MPDLIKVEVLGIKIQAIGGSCNCSSGCCDPSKTMGEMFLEGKVNKL